MEAALGPAAMSRAQLVAMDQARAAAGEMVFRSAECLEQSQC